MTTNAGLAPEGKPLQHLGMLSRKLHPRTCLFLLRIAWMLMAVLVIVAVLGFRGIVPLSVVGIATVVLGALAMVSTFLAAEHSGEISDKEERDVLDRYRRHTGQ